MLNDKQTCSDWTSVLPSMPTIKGITCCAPQALSCTFQWTVLISEGRNTSCCRCSSRSHGLCSSRSLFILALSCWLQQYPKAGSGLSIDRNWNKTAIRLFRMPCTETAFGFLTASSRISRPLADSGLLYCVQNVIYLQCGQGLVYLYPRCHR